MRSLHPTIRQYSRRLHRALAPVMLTPLLITLITGVMFHVAALTGKAEDYLWLLALHRGQFGRINLEVVYVFFNAAGLLFLLISGLLLWLQSSRRRKAPNAPQADR